MTMDRSTVDFGIDLGTTNSAIAVLRGVDDEVIKNNADADPDNTAAEFKLRRGTAGQSVNFAASGRVLTPTQLSAEVLKSVRADVQQRLGEDIESAVVTVPAAFDMSACDATRAAAEE